MHICFIVEGYPIPEDPFMPFIRELAAEMVKQGVKCSVIAPQSITRAITHKLPIRPRKWKDHIQEEKFIDIYQPYYITLSGLFPKLNWLFMIISVRKAYKRIHESVDTLYSHFWHMGVVASKNNSSLPIFVACGESRIEVQDDFSEIEIEKMLSELCGIIYVGSKSFKDAKDIGLQKNQPYIIAPNGYDESRFRKRDRQKCREELGWPQDAYIVSFVGSFNSRKGIDRLNDAIKQSNEEIFSCFIGDGNIKPDCKNILFSGKLPHDAISKYLNASNVFVLPTNNEGCCNAIVEALACGLPVISSNQSFNDDILDDSCSIRVDPQSIDDIRNAMEMLKDRHRRELLSKGALAKANDLTISRRAKRIIDFISYCMSEGE